MADKEIIEKRAGNYEKSKRKKFLTYMGVLTGATLVMSLCAFASLYSKNSSKLVQSLRNSAKLFDYNKGIYMSRLPLFIGSAITCIGPALAARNNTERKDVTARFGIPLTIFYGGDLLLSSLFTNLSDRVLGTKLCKEDGSNKSAINKIFPKIKSVKQVMEEVEQGKISKINCANIISEESITNCTMRKGSFAYAQDDVNSGLVRRFVASFTPKKTAGVIFSRQLVTTFTPKRRWYWNF